MELTPMRVKFKPPGASDFTDLGGTLENVTISIAIKKSNIVADQMGKTPLDSRVSAYELKVTTALAESLNQNFWKILFPHAALIAGTGTFAGKTAFDFNSMIGDASLANAGYLNLHPLSLPDTVLDYDFNIFKACSTAESELVRGPETQDKLKIVWQVFPDMSASPAKFMRFGNPSLV
jgi:hypothetical protein